MTATARKVLADCKKAHDLLEAESYTFDVWQNPSL